MNTKVNILLKQVIEIVRNESFVEDYRAKATQEECIGLALSSFFGYSGGSILKTCYAGLEDANFHTENEVIEALIERPEITHNIVEFIQNQGEN